MSSDEKKEHHRKGKSTSGSWVPGQSGNPKGRPKKNKILGDLLHLAGEESFKYQDADGRTRNIKYSEFIAKQVMDALATGYVTFPAMGDESERKMTLDPGDYNRLLQFYFQRVDGLAKKAPKEESDKRDEIPADEMIALRDTRWAETQKQLGELLEQEENEVEAKPETRLSN